MLVIAHISEKVRALPKH